MPDIVLSLHQKYWDGMVQKKKLWEIRKNSPKATYFKAYIYETLNQDGAGMIVGEITVDFVVEHKSLIDTDTEGTMLDLMELYDYAKGKPLRFWHIREVKKYHKPLPLSAFGLTKPPMSWGYVKYLPITCYSISCSFSK